MAKVCFIAISKRNARSPARFRPRWTGSNEVSLSYPRNCATGFYLAILDTNKHTPKSFFSARQTGGGPSISNYSGNAMGNCGLKSMKAVDKHAEKARRSHGPKLIHTLDTRT